MDLPQFLLARRPDWESLEQLLRRAETGGLKSLEFDEARALAQRYRAASSDLLWVRARAGSPEVAEYVNDLVGRAYALIHPASAVRLADLTGFVLRGFPTLFWREWRMFLVAVLLTVAGAGFGYLGVALDPQGAAYLVPEDHQSLDPTERAAEEATKRGATVGEQAAFASFLFTHNIGVAFLAFALGLTAGVGTGILLFSNGLMLGALARIYELKHLTGWFWAWILPHGIPELTAICISGAAGLILARGLVAPRGATRGVALRHESGTALKMLFGTLVLFILAGLIEGTISQIHPPRLSIAFKLTFALGVGSAVYAYLFSAAFKPRPLTGVRGP